MAITLRLDSLPRLYGISDMYQNFSKNLLKSHSKICFFDMNFCINPIPEFSASNGISPETPDEKDINAESICGEVKVFNARTTFAIG